MSADATGVFTEVSLGIYVSRDSIVCIETGHGLDDRKVGVRVNVGSRIFSMSKPPLMSTEPPIQWVPGALSRV
jgi:hypothetical protein